MFRHEKAAGEANCSGGQRGCHAPRQENRGTKGAVYVVGDNLNISLDTQSREDLDVKENVVLAVRIYF